jgi:hypothetical protein
VDGTIRSTAYITLGTQGFGADLDITWCRDGSCRSLAGGTLSFPELRACATVYGVTACAQL